MASANGIDAGTSGGLSGWLGSFFNPQGLTQQQLQQQQFGGYVAPSVGSMFGGAVSKIEEIAIRAALIIVGLALLLGGFYLAGRGGLGDAVRRLPALAE